MNEVDYLMGKWVYNGSCKNISGFFENIFGDYKDKSMPEMFFMTRDFVGTDLNGESGDFSQYIGYTKRIITLNTKGKEQKSYWWLRGEDDYIILIEREGMMNNAIHIYHKENGNLYTMEDIEKLLNEKNKVVDKTDFNCKMLGNWVIFDKIKENEINDYDGNVHNEDKYPELSPLFDCFEVISQDEVHVMTKEIGDFEILGKKFTYDKAIMKLQMTGEDNFYFRNRKREKGIKNEGLYRKIGDDEFIFVDVDKKVDLNKDIYVYKKLTKPL